MSDAASEIVSFAKRHGVRIVSDGDLDGIFASALLLMGLKSRGIDFGDPRRVVQFPHPRTLKGLRVEASILVELPPSKGLVYSGENLLIDHHPEPPRVELYSETEVVRRHVVEGARSAASLVARALSVKLPEEAMEIIRAVDDADNLTYTTELSRLLHAAYQLHVTEPEMRYMLLTLALEGKWQEIKKWAVREGRVYLEVVPKKVEELVRRARQLTKTAVVFTYDADDKLEKAAVTEAMRRLEERHPIVIALGLSEGKPDSARVATMRDIDLTKIFSWLVKHYGQVGLTAGGRKSVGGVQFRGSTITTVEEALNMLRRALTETIESSTGAGG